MTINDIPITSVGFSLFHILKSEIWCSESKHAYILIYTIQYSQLMYQNHITEVIGMLFIHV